MAESEGFEPPDRANGQWFSKPPHSTALPTLHCFKFFKSVNYTEFEKNSQMIFLLRDNQSSLKKSIPIVLIVVSCLKSV